MSTRMSRCTVRVGGMYAANCMAVMNEAVVVWHEAAILAKEMHGTMVLVTAVPAMWTSPNRIPYKGCQLEYLVPMSGGGSNSREVADIIKAMQEWCRRRQYTMMPMETVHAVEVADPPLKPRT